MRPLALTLQAFGAFLAPQTLDFTELGGHRLFLIAGPTGAGKTTLLDALCFALYGDSSGEERTAEQMRSDHADPETRTEVQLDFALGEKRYRIRRIPRQERAKRRGGGTTLEKADATLWSLGADRTEGAVLATGWGNVTAAVERLVGFRSAQFRQVILLPQGRFRELLVARAGEREQILTTLFRTEIYSRIQEALKTRAAAIAQSAKELEAQRRTLLDQAGAEDLERLVQRITEQAAAIAESAVQVAGLKSAEQTAVAALQAGRIARERLDARDRAAAALGALESLEPQIERRRAALDAARRAQSLADLAAGLHRDHETLARVEQSRDRAQRTLARARLDQETAESRLRAEEALAPQRQALGIEIDRLGALQERVKRLAEAQAARDRAEQLATRRTNSAEQAATQATACQSALAQAQAQRETLAPDAARAETLAVQLDTLSRRLADRQALDQARVARDQAETAQARASAALDEAERTLSARRTDQETLHRRWTRGQAQILAATLAEGAPCPVCGSSHHPAPALGDTPVPTDADLEAAKQSVLQAESVRDRAQEAMTGLVGQLAVARTRVDALEQALGTHAALAAEAIAAALKTHRTALAAAREAQATRDALLKDLPALERRSADAQESARRAETERAESDRNLAAAQAALAEREAEVPQPWRAPDALAQAIAEKTRALALAQEREQSARDLARAAGQALAAAEAALAGQDTQLQTARDRFAATRSQWTERRAAAGFADDDAFRAARLDPADAARLERSVAEHDRAIQAARTTLSDAAVAAGGLAPPDLPALEAAERQTREAREYGERALATAQVSQTQLERLRSAVTCVAAALAERESDYAILGRLAEVANGKNPARLSFQRFVLAALLDDVLIAASQRLLAMSRGRYRLERGQVAADQRSAGGLDLLVDDGYTGKLRGVETLSGGEGFQAALSLALGLAEVVQAYAGGVRLDTILIDEGFGSLDPEALELAVDTLMDLQQGGRLVGVISHVPELKERIDVRLEVTPGRGGSQARFRLP